MLPLLLLFFYINRADIHCLHTYTTRRVPVPSCYPHGFRSVAPSSEPRFQLGPALQQADALLSEPRRTLSEPLRTLI
jgi:hypothetical protein